MTRRKNPGPFACAFRLLRVTRGAHSGTVMLGGRLELRQVSITASVNWYQNPWRQAVPDVLVGLRTRARRPPGDHGGWLLNTMVPAAANMPPTPCATEIFAPGTCAGAMPRNCRTHSCIAYIPYMPECM